MTNYQLVTDRIISALKGKTPRLLLHCCCAPCSSYVLEYLTEYFEITLFFYNPNITEKSEYDKRKNELVRFVSEMKFKNPVTIVDGDYSPEVFFEMARGLETCPERSERCFLCYEQRLRRSAKFAREGNYDYFCTTLSVSPHKNSAKLNEIGARLENECGVPYLYSDFKKRNGYKRSIELSAQHGLYRQNYCGCVFSRKAAENQKNCEK